MEDKNVIPEIVRVDIKTEIVKEEPIEAEDSFVECETCKENSTSEKDCAHRPSDRLGLPRGECRTNDPEEDVKPKVEPDDRESLSDDLIDKLIESGVTEKEENYHDVPEILPEDTDFLRTEIKMEEVDIDSVKDELDNNEASISSEALGQEEDSNENPKPGPSEEAKKGGPEECKKKWASIRDQFRRTLQKRKTKSGQAAAKKQKYKYEEVLDFLLPHIMGRETLSNVPSCEEKTDDSELNPRMEESELDPESEAESQKEVSQCSGNSQTIVQPTSPVPLAGRTQATPRKKHYFARPVNVKRTGANVQKTAHESPSSQLMAYILAEKETERNQTICATNPPQHPVDIFLASLAPTLKSLDPILLNQAKTAIFATVQEFELKQLNRITTNPLGLDMADLPSFATAAGSSSTSHSSLTNESPHENSPHMDCSTSFFDL
nr:midasin-like isoform X2 [Leptinotarsa decemlineata]